MPAESAKKPAQAGRTPAPMSGVQTTILGCEKMLLTVDWLAFRVREVPENDIFSFLGIFHPEIQWRLGGPCFNSYLESWHYGHITIGTKGIKGFDFYVNLSGQGCREFEDLMPDEWQWEDFLYRLAADENVHFSRIDIAGDERDGYFNIDRLDRYIKANKYATKCKMPTLQKYGREVCYIGGTQSNVLMRIYNKKLERGYAPEDDDGRPWWRCELKLTDEYVRQFLVHAKEYSPGYAFSAHCKNHIRWLSKPNDKKNSQRINTAKWYSDFLGECEKLKFTTAGTAYNISKLQRFCLKSAGSSVVTLAKFFNMTPEQFYAYFVENDEIKLRADQIDLLQAKGLNI